MAHKNIITIVVPTYNRSKYLERCLNSILSHEGDYYEVIVSDNASPDNTQELMKKYLDDSRVIYFRNETNIGFRKNVYKATGYAQGEYIFWLSDDDYLLPNSLPKIVDVIRTHPEAGYIFSPLVSVDDRSKEVFSECHFSLKDELIDPSVQSVFAISKVTNVFSRQILKRDYIDWETWEKFIDNAYPSIILSGRIILRFPSYYISEQLVVHTWYNLTYWHEFGNDEIVIALTTSRDYKNSVSCIFHDHENTKEINVEYSKWKLNALCDYLYKPSGFFKLIQTQGKIRGLFYFTKVYQPDLTEITYLSKHLIRVGFSSLRQTLKKFFKKFSYSKN